MLLSNLWEPAGIFENSFTDLEQKYIIKGLEPTTFYAGSKYSSTEKSSLRYRTFNQRKAKISL
jgi:hypothetical protein